MIGACGGVASTSHRSCGFGAKRPLLPAAGRRGVQGDIPAAVVRFFDTGHFALETHAAEIAAGIRDFL
jgi:hypothetical protein